MFRKIVQLVFLILLLSCDKTGDIQNRNLFYNNKIWTNGDYNSFTSLIKHENIYYCAFRKGSAHVSYDIDLYGSIVIISMDPSSKSNVWTQVCEIKINGEDLRDPKLEIYDGHLAIRYAGVLFNHETKRVLSTTNYLSIFSSLDTNNFSVEYETRQIAIDCKNDYGWLWSVKNFNGFFYSILYGNYKAFMMMSNDGLNFTTHLDLNDIIIDDVHYIINESSICFSDDGIMYILARTFTENGKGIIGVAKYPYNVITWQVTPIHNIGGPNIIFDNGYIYISTRGDDGTVLLRVDSETISDYKLIAASKMQGDTGYPGLIFDNANEIWMSYYCGNMTNISDIYLMKIRIID